MVLRNRWLPNVMTDILYMVFDHACCQWVGREESEWSTRHWMPYVFCHVSSRCVMLAECFRLSAQNSGSYYSHRDKPQTATKNCASPFWKIRERGAHVCTLVSAVPGISYSSTRTVRYAHDGRLPFHSILTKYTS